MYNLHGINNGRSGLLNLCNNVNIHIIAVQEHWLHDSNLHLLNSIHPDFVGFSISSTGWRKKTGPPAILSHCKYSENSMTELHENWWTSAILYAEHCY